MAVLVNAGSASAAEIVTGALKDTNRAVIVGERSFGKGSVQSIFKLKNGEGLRLTTAHYYMPSGGAAIHEHGVSPQVEVVLSADEDEKVRLQEERDDITDPAGNSSDRFGLRAHRGSAARGGDRRVAGRAGVCREQHVRRVGQMILALESSCDETAVAFFDPARGLAGEWVHSQIALHERHGGVVPDLATREHLRTFAPLLARVRTTDEFSRVKEVAVTCGPGLAGCLAVGVAARRALSRWPCACRWPG